MMDLVPAELAEPMQRLLEMAEELDADPGVTSGSADPFLTFGVERIEQLLRDGDAVQGWYRRHCGPPTAVSDWCEAFASASLDRAIALVQVTYAPNPTNLLGAADEASIALYRAIVDEAPPEVAPAVQLLLDQYEANGGRQPTDDDAVAPRAEAQDAIVASVNELCGMDVDPTQL
jgi:hypothetical protein